MNKSIEQTANEMWAAVRLISKGVVIGDQVEQAVRAHFENMERANRSLAGDFLAMRDERDALQERCASVDKAYRLSQEANKVAGEVIRSQTSSLELFLRDGQAGMIESLRAENAAMAQELEHLRNIRKCHKAAQEAFAVMDEALHGSLAETAEKALEGRE